MVVYEGFVQVSHPLLKMIYHLKAFKIMQSIMLTLRVMLIKQKVDLTFMTS